VRRIGGLLGRSPYGPLYEQIAKVSSCVREVPGLLVAMGAGSRAEVQAIAAHIHRLEHEADEVKSEIRAHLSNSLFNSVERSEVLMLITMIDSLADDAENVSKLVTIRATAIPADIVDQFVRLGEGANEAATRIAAIIGMMRDLVEQASIRVEAGRLLEAIADFGQYSCDVEEMELAFLRALFAREDQVGPIDILFLMKISAQVSAIARSAENVAETVRRMVLNR
jgi:predicted phosphate transport protein (TIGR00153 family)